MKIKSVYRTHTCGELRAENIGETVKLSGWIDTIRDHGGITFLDLRDNYGKTQLVLYTLPEIRIPKESVISVTGQVRARDKSTFNPKISTGEIEVVVSEVKMLSECKSSLPFEIQESEKVNEEVRLKYRYLDLRNEDMHKSITLRSQIIRDIRLEMENLGFMEFQTPILTASSPEGARDFLVPSRLNPGKFYALPQAPQQFKQLLMASGFDRYFQIAPCFRDEDARADRCPGEFYQLDVEMSFAGQEEVFEVMETVLPVIFEKYGKLKVDSAPFKRISYRDSIETYGTDKPDLRNPLVIVNITDVFAETTFSAFKGQVVRAICAPGGTSMSRKSFDELTDAAVANGAKGLAWLKVDENKNLVGPIVKYMTETEQKSIIEKLNGNPGDAIFIIADESKLCAKIMSVLRTMLCDKLGLLEEGVYKFCWIVDFPMFEINEETGKIDFSHNPFSMPQGGMEALSSKGPLDILAYQYDLVVNGVELSSGAVRNHDSEIMSKVFEIAGYSEEELETKFSALYTAFKFGAPPHAGIAPGIDRMVMLLLGKSSVREVVAFPMNKKAQDVLMGAPGTVTEKQLREVHIKLR